MAFDDFFHVDLAYDVESILGHVFLIFLNKESTLELSEEAPCGT
jgi:hypothetical protein